MFSIFHENLVQSYMYFILFYAKYMPGQFVFRYSTDTFVICMYRFIKCVLLSTYYIHIIKNKTTDAFSVQETYFKQYILIDVLYMYELLHNFYKITMWVEKLCYGTCTCSLKPV